MISGISIFMTMVAGSLYRNYIYSRNIYDYGLADMHTNIGAVLSASFLFMGYKKYYSCHEETRIIIECVLGFIIYEFIQLTPLIGQFDIKDIIGTLIGGTITFVIHKIIRRGCINNG